MFIKIDGFDHYVAPGHAATSLANYLSLAGYTTGNITNDNFAIVTGPESIGAALKLTLTQGAATPPSMSYSMTSTENLVAFGFNFRGTGARQRVCRINALVDLDWDVSTGRFRIGSNQGASIIILNAWWYVEVVIDKTQNEIRVYANDMLQITEPLPGWITNTHTITWGLTSSAEATGTIEIDDFYALDSSNADGAVNVDRRGPITVTTRQPQLDVEAGWTVVNSQTTNHWEIAAQLDPGRVSAPYLQANIEGRTDKYKSNVVLPNNNEIFAVALVAFARKGDLDERSLGMLVGTDGGNSEKSAVLTESFRYHSAIFEQAPGNTPWTQNSVESSEFGPVAR